MKGSGSITIIMDNYIPKVNTRMAEEKVIGLLTLMTEIYMKKVNLKMVTEKVIM